MKKIRLIALDLDGTLLDDEKSIPPENREALKEASDRGILIAIASGRMTPRIEPIERLLGIDCVIIAYNGGKVIAPRKAGRAVLAHRPVPAKIAEVFIRFSRERGHLLNFYHEDVLYAEDGPSRRPFMEIYVSRTGAEYCLEGDLSRFFGVSPTKLILLADPPERDRLYGEFRARFAAEASILKSDPEYLEIMAPGVDKGSALEEIAGYYGIGMDEVLAIGDADNDVRMLSLAGLGVAVSNGGAHVKAAAKVVTQRTNNEGAVAEAVRKWAMGPLGPS
jgi:hypothetical protein